MAMRDAVQGSTKTDAASSKSTNQQANVYAHFHQ